MATYYVDPIGGSDASAGTSFATRWQTLTSGATSARITAGDTIRVIASPDPTSMGQNATWTDGSQTVALTSAVTTDIYQSGAWTSATTNVTITTSTNRKIGATSASISPATAFTTGLAAYYTIPGGPINFSSYQQVSFWINITAGSMSADGDITLCLCSDTAGATVVNTISVPRLTISSKWQSITVDTGAALGSSIQSIALYVAVDRGAQTFLVNNVLACQASSSGSSLTLTSLIGKNTGYEPFLPIQSISGTTVLLDFNPQYSLTSSNIPTYSGVTETVTAYKRETIIMPSAFTVNNGATWGTINKGGSSGSPITFSGGWNRTDMSTQTGDTYISGVNNGMYGIYMPDPAGGATKAYINVTNINPIKCQYGYILYTGNSGPGYLTNVSITAKDCNSNTYGIYLSNGTPNPYYFDAITISVNNIQGSITSGFYNLGGNYLQPSTMPYNITIINNNSNYGVGSTLGGSYGNYNITNCNRNTGTGVTMSVIKANVTIGNINHTFSPTAGLTLVGTLSSIINVTSSISSNNIGIIFSSPSSISNVFNFGTATISNTTDFATNIATLNTTIYGGSYTSSGIVWSTVTDTELVLVNPTNLSTVSIPSFTSGASATASRIAYSGVNGINNDNRIYYNTNFGNIVTDSTTGHTASGVSWKMTSGTYTNSTFPLSLPIATIACNSSTLVTASVWVYRSSTSLVTSLVCPGGQIPGVASAVSTNAAAAINTWEQLTITFTPSAQGVVQLYVNCYGASATVNVDDFSVSQA